MAYLAFYPEVVGLVDVASNISDAIGNVTTPGIKSEDITLVLGDDLGNRAGVQGVQQHPTLRNKAVTSIEQISMYA